MRLRWVTANMYVGNFQMGVGILRLLAHLRRRGWAPPHSIGLQEGSRYANQLLGLALYRRENSTSSHELYRSNPILVRRGLGRLRPPESWLAAQGWRNEDGTFGTHPPRTIQASFYRAGRRPHVTRVAHLNTHLHWVVDQMQDAPVSYRDMTRLLRQYYDHVNLLFDLAQKYRRDGFQVVVTADGNARPTTGDWFYAIYNVFERHNGWTVTRHGVDVIIWSTDQLERTYDVLWVDKSVTGSDDHDAGAARVKVAS